MGGQGQGVDKEPGLKQLKHLPIWDDRFVSAAKQRRWLPQSQDDSSLFSSKVGLGRAEDGWCRLAWSGLVRKSKQTLPD